MSRLLLADALLQIAPEALPADATQQIPWINRVTERFFSVGKWAGTTVRWKGVNTAASFAIYNDAYGGRYVTLPRQLLSVLGAGYGDTQGSLRACFSSVPIRGPWFEFGNAGYIGDPVGASGLVDAGDGWTCFRDITEDSYMRVKTEVAETALAEMLFRGLDENEEPIYTGAGAASYEGVKLVIGSALTTTTTQIFSAIPSLIRKPVTYGPVRLFGVSVVTGTETLIGMYDPGDTAPGFRRYRIACTADSTTLHGMFKRRHIPALVDADEVIPAHVGAIELGLQGRRYDLSNDPKTAAQYWIDAFGLLNATLGEFHGGANPQVQFKRGSGLASIPRY